MNRRERRATKKNVTTAPPSPGKPLPMAPVVGADERPGLFLRVFARALVSAFVIKRVSNPEVLRMMREVARQSGRMDALLRIQTKLDADGR